MTAGWRVRIGVLVAASMVLFTIGLSLWIDQPHTPTSRFIETPARVQP